MRGGSLMIIEVDTIIKYILCLFDGSVLPRETCNPDTRAYSWEKLIMNPEHIDFPQRFESPLQILRNFRPGAGEWDEPMSLRKQERLQWYKADNVAANIESVHAR